jgi:plastocyanin
MFDTGDLQAGQSTNITFSTAGSYVFNCTPHPWMVGEVIVQ